ncbi:hypothetical protein WJX72_009413 [[Myrmecia] bisecta]|uniref:50S ribosomal protein L25 n=1 Tax=[Myrmecia] bisecta TaxID=41462 RepID=A0AAW1R901_9CHLO
MRTAAVTQPAELVTLTAWPRDCSGRLASAKLRKAGRMPAVLFSLDSNRSQLISVIAGEVSRQVQLYGRRSVVCKVFNVCLENPAGGPSQNFRCLLRQVHINSVTDRVENVTLMHCPAERLVRMEVPVMVVGDDVSPGVKRGGFANLTRRFIKMLCPGDSIPPVMEVDVSNLDIGDRVMLSDLTFPPGVQLLEKDASQPVCKIAGKLRREEPAAAAA